MDSILNYLAQVDWQALGIYLLAGGGVSLLSRAVIAYRDWEKGSTRIKTVGVISVLTSSTDWIIQNYSSSPLPAFGTMGPKVFAAAVFMHEVVLKPAGKASKWLATTSAFNVFNDAKAYRAERKLQASTPPDTTNEFN